MNKSVEFFDKSQQASATFTPGFQPAKARDKIDLAILALMLQDDKDKAIREAFMHCHMAFDGVSSQTLQSFFTGHGAVAFEILQGLMGTADSLSASIYDRAEGLSVSQRQHFCNALLVVFGALCAAESPQGQPRFLGR